jgi:hypothetical protein
VRRKPLNNTNTDPDSDPPRTASATLTDLVLRLWAYLGWIYAHEAFTPRAVRAADRDSLLYRWPGSPGSPFLHNQEVAIQSPDQFG